LAHWGLRPAEAQPFVASLSQVQRRSTGLVTDDEVAGLMRVDPFELCRLLPPFGAIVADADCVTMVADSMGFRQLFHSRPGVVGLGVMSTSGLLAGRARGASLDRVGVAVQSLLGWQLGQRTLLEHIRKMEPG